MTTVVYPSLDGLLAAATPVEDEPFTDGDYAVMHGWLVGKHVGCNCVGGGEWPHEPTCGWEPLAKIDDIRGAVTGIDQARRIAVALEQECADKDARIAEADRWLDMAATYATSEDVAAAIDDARAALRGGA